MLDDKLKLTVRSGQRTFPSWSLSFRHLPLTSRFLRVFYCSKGIVSARLLWVYCFCFSFFFRPQTQQARGAPRDAAGASVARQRVHQQTEKPTALHSSAMLRLPTTELWMFKVRAFWQCCGRHRPAVQGVCGLRILSVLPRVRDSLQEGVTQSRNR
jgi:hypothetical protein